MGMAASQVRLLMLTARMHDIEYKAQSIQNAKIQLATQSDQVYQEYLNALDAKTLTITDVNGQTVAANFNNMCGRNAIELACKDGTNRQGVMMYDDKGRLIVTDDMFELYNEFGKGDDAYAFAIYALTGEKVDIEDLREAEDGLLDEESVKALSQYGNEIKDLLTTPENEVTKEDVATYDGIKQQIDTNYPDSQEKDKRYEKSQEILKKYENTEKSLRYKLYRNPENAETVFGNMANVNDNISLMDFDEDDFNYYVNEYKKMEANGGNVINISTFNGVCNGIANTDSEWLQNQIQSGKITMASYSFNNKTGEVETNATSPTTDSSISYTTTTSLDKSELAKVEAKYEHDMKEINRKDKAFDMDLSKLDAERTAIKTEYEQVKTVTKDNIERTFGIFS